MNYNRFTKRQEVKDEIVNNIEEELPDKDITLGEAVENYVDYGVSYDIPPRRTKETENAGRISCTASDNG